MTLARYCLIGWVTLTFVLFVIPVGSAAEDASLAPRLAGIGVRMGMQGAGAVYPTVTEVSPGGSAARSGIGTGDRLVGIVDEAGQFVDFQGKGLGEVAALVRGPSGTTLRLVVETKGSDGRRLYELTRAPPAEETPAAPQKSAPSSAESRLESASDSSAAASAPATVRVHFFRESGFVGSMLNYRVEHNGKAIGNLGNGAYFSYDSPTGQQNFSAVGNFGRGGSFTFQSGQSYYIELSVVPFSASLQLVSQERGGEAIRSMR